MGVPAPLYSGPGAGPPCADPGAEGTRVEKGRYDGAGRVPPRSSGSSSCRPPSWQSPGAERRARTGRAGQGRRGASGRSTAKSAQVPTRLALQIWADLARQRTLDLRAAAPLPPLTRSALAACSAPRRSLCHRRCHTSRPPPPELQTEPSRAELRRDSARAPASLAPPSEVGARRAPAPSRAAGKGGTCGTLLGGSPRGWAARANGSVERGRNSAELGLVRLEDNECSGQLGSGLPWGTRMEGEAQGPGLTATPGEQGTEEARLELGCPWVVEPGEWRDAAGLWLPLAARLLARSCI